MVHHKVRALTADTVLRAALWLILLSVVASTRTDPDLWGHVRFGTDILRTLTVRQADAYSFTSDREWVNHEWAAEAVFGGAFVAAGAPGLVIVKVLIVFGVLALLNVMLRREGVDAPRERDLLIAAAVITTIEQAHHIRPQLFSLLFFAILLCCLQLARGNVRYLACLPLLFGLWANFHGGWIVGGGVLFLWTVTVVLSKPTRLRTALCYGAAGLGSLAATLINPEGPGLLSFLRDTVGFGRADIVDWQPVYALGANILALWSITAALATLGLIALRRSGGQVERMVVVAALAIGSFRVNRLLGFFALATLFLLGAAIASWLPRLRRVSLAPPRRRTAAVAMMVAVMLFAGAFRTLASSAACIQVDTHATAEPEAVAFLKRHAGPGRLLVWFDWGQYALWHLGPDLRVSIDGRRETVYSASMQDRHLRFFFDASGGAALPTELRADYIWLPKQLPAATRLIAEGWPQLYVGERSVIFGRPLASAAPRGDDVVGSIGSTVRPSTSAPPALSGGARCFPNP